ncbi:hypothetical protein [Phenylobacterium sp.]|uniref:hypothetical protein n=1 Tax=Phenylobacterium sp. TaxID=1871053 RepID=UPI002811182F|nr:hypothetical protein [Phenylobacterium sp.]
MSAATAALRPFLWLAAIAFLIGFLSYLALGRPGPAMAHPTEDAGWSATVSAPVSDEWNTPKHI